MHSQDMCPEFLSLAAHFEDSGVPIAIFDKSLALIFANKSLIDIYPEAKSPFFALKVFGGCDVETVLNYLKSEKRYNLICNIDGEELSLSADAVTNVDSDIIGAFIVFNEKQKSTSFLSEKECMMAVNREFRDRISMMFTSIYGISNSKTFIPSITDCEYINSINQNCFQLLRVSDNLSRILKITSQNDCASFSAFDLVAFMIKLVGTINVMDNKGGVPISFKCNEENIFVKADMSRLEFSIANIILNSIKYTRDGNSIEVELKTVGDNAVITISDKGIGMPREVLSRVGEPYFSYSHSNKFEAGFGIGLYLAKKYIASNGGMFAIQSEENEGTVVTLTIPLYNKTDGDLTFNEPPVFRPQEKFSNTAIQLSEVCFYPTV